MGPMCEASHRAQCCLCWLAGLLQTFTAAASRESFDWSCQELYMGSSACKYMLNHHPDKCLLNITDACDNLWLFEKTALEWFQMSYMSGLSAFTLPFPDSLPCRNLAMLASMLLCQWMVTTKPRWTSMLTKFGQPLRTVSKLIATQEHSESKTKPLFRQDRKKKPTSQHLLGETFVKPSFKKNKTQPPHKF